MTTSPIPPASPPAPSRRRPRRLIVAVLLLICVALIAGGLAGTSLIGSRGGMTLARSQVFRWAATTYFGPNQPFDLRFLDPDELNSYPASNPPFARQLTSLLFDHLVVLDANLRIEDWGASSIAVSPDGTVYTFTLRPNQRFSDGTPVLASDYAYALDRALNPCVYSPASYLLLALRDALSYSSEPCPNGHMAAARQTLIGDSILPDDGAGTLSLVLTRPAAYFLDALTTGPAVALDPRVVPATNRGDGGDWTATLANGPTGQGGSGMYYLAHWDRYGTLVLKLNPYWWGLRADKRPHLTEIDVRFFPNPQQANSAYDSATGSEQFDYQDADLPGQLAGPGAPRDVRHALSLGVTSIVFNWKWPPFNALDARQAFCLAINRDALVRDVWHGAAVTTWHLVPQGMFGYSPNLTGIDGVTATGGDLAAAHAHWATYVNSLHGQPVGTIAIGPFNGPPDEPDFYNAITQQWYASFSGISLEAYMAPDILQDVNSPLALGSTYPFTWLTDYPDPQDLLWFPYGSSAPFLTLADESLPPGTGLPDVDALFNRADALYQPADQPLRLALYAQAEQELIQQVAVCPIAQTETLYRLRDYVHGCLPNALGVIPADAWVSCFLAQH